MSFSDDDDKPPPNNSYDSDGASQFEQKYDPSFKKAVEEAIKAGLDLDFHGGFAHEATTNPAPNPGLEVQGCGPIGLPLSAAAACTLISACEQAPFGKGERSVVDREVRDTWQVDGEKVRFTNPAWEEFIQKSVEGVCDTLGVEADNIGLRCELYKLLVYEQGSHFLPHVDTEKQNGMFATMVIVLPSLFEGGAVHLTHGNQTKILDVGGPLSAFRTSVLAWYTDVMHEVKPITSGYRLALAYNLIRSDSSPTLVAPSQDPTAAALAESLSAWLNAVREGKNVPTKLAWHLEHKYSRANMRLSALKSKDAYLAKRLLPITKDLGLRLGLAIVTMMVRGHFPADEDSEWDLGHKLMDEDDLRGQLGSYVFCKLRYLVDLEGRPVCEAPRFSHWLDGEMMPVGWDDTLAGQKADKQEYEGYQGNGPGDVFHWYRRTSLVIWPEGTQL